MDKPRMLSGSELVAKGATKKVDGQLPQSGLKEVTANGSWLEQKQIQSALEARKHLIAVERIEKSGSLSHAEWRDDLKLAEVTKQTGGHWQYIGHKKGKHLYLLPEEALFLMEVNSLLLKHNDVTVSLQKAYALCLTEMPLMQYKVYASLSRLGYRVFRHKEPKTIEENHRHIDSETVQSDGEKLVEECKEKTNDSAIDNSSELSIISTTEEKLVVECKEKTNDSAIDNSSELSTISTTEETKLLETTEENIDSVNISVKNSETEDDSVADVQMQDTSVDGKTKDGEFNPNVAKTGENKMEVDDNNITSSTDSTNADKEVIQNGVTQSNEKTAIKNENTTNNESNTDKTNITEKFNDNNKAEEIICQEVEKASNNDNVAGDNAKNVDKATTASTTDVDSGNENTTLVCISEIIAIKQETTEDSPHTIDSGIMYSIDEIGVVRPGEKLALIDTGPVSFIEISVPSNSNISAQKTKDMGSNESSKHYQIEISHYEEKIKQISDRKPANHHLDALQDFYKELITDVNVPEEKYLPRNIFLHKTAYRLNMDVVRNQNASNVSSDEVDSIESPTRPPNVPNIQNHVYPPNYENFSTNAPNFHSSQNTPPRYQNYRHDRPQYYRQNYNMFRPPLQMYFQTRWRHHNDYMRQQYMNLRRDTMKSYHYNTIVNIATRFKNGLVANTSQIRALHSLLNTYNLRYNATLGVTPDYTIIDTKYQPQPEPTVENIIVLDDEPKRKKQRLNDDNDKAKTNLEKLKELAATLKDLHAKNLASSRHRRVFSNAIKSYNKSFKADIYLDSNFEIVDRKLVILDSSSDSEVVVKEKERPRKRKKLRNPYSILRHAAKEQDQNTSAGGGKPQLLNHSNAKDETSQNVDENHANTNLTSVDKGEGLLKYFDKAWLPSDDDFGRAEPCLKQKAQLDALLYQAEYLQDILKESTDFESWKDVKLSVLKEIRGSLDVQKQQVEALSNDFYMETESQIRPILEKGCTDLKTALKTLSIIPTNKEIKNESSLRIHFDVCNRDVPFKKSNPPKPNFRVVCYEESAPFPPSAEVASLQSKYKDGVPTVFAFVGISASITYLQIKPVDIPIFLPEEMA